MPADRQTEKHAHRNTLHHYGGGELINGKTAK